MLNVKEIFDKKLLGQNLSEEEIDFIIQSYHKNKISDSKMVKFMQGINENNFTYEETYFMAKSMARTGKLLKTSEVTNSIVVDKHSAGLISDSSTLIFMSILASLGVKCIKVMSGYYGSFRNSVDRFSAIKGFNSKISNKRFFEILNENNMAVVEEADEIAPVDKRLYRLRVDNKIVSIPLIASSILSKKIAAGANVLVFDVKEGEGSIENKDNFSTTLAEYLTNSAKLAGLTTASVVTNLDSPLTSNIGNKPEVKEALLALRDGEVLYNAKLILVAKELVILALMLTKTAKGRTEANSMFEKAIKSKIAYEKFCEFVKAYNGDVESILESETYLDNVGMTYITSDEAGYIGDIKLGKIKSSYDALLFKTKSIKDTNAGINLLAVEGEKINKGDKLARLVFSLDNKNIFNARKTLKEAFVISKTKPEVSKTFNRVVV